MTKKQTPLAYIGPTIRNVAVHGTVYAGAIPDALARMKQHIPVLADLIVPADTLAASMRSVKTAGTNLYTRYHAAKKAIKEGVR